MHDFLWSCVVLYDTIWFFIAMYDSALLCMVLCGSVGFCMTLRINRHYISNRHGQFDILNCFLCGANKIDSSDYCLSMFQTSES
jgi:hypothetical protein